MTDKIYLNILKGGVLASLAMLFFVFSGFLFPYITSKQLSFNILIEVLLIVLIVFIIKFPKYRPKKSLLTWGLIAYFISIALSLFVSVDFNLSFWGDTERMLGFFHLSHFLVLYFIIITVFRSKKDYALLFNGIIISAIVVAIYGFAIGNMNSTIGNCAYVAAIMLIAMFLEAYFFIEKKEWWEKLIYAVAFIISIIGFFKADISGAQAGLMVGIFTSILVLILISKNKKTKIISLSALIIFIAVLVSLFAFRFNPVFDNTYVGKALRDFSTQNATLNTRLISYKSAGHYLIDNPITLIFGVGHGNYSTIFDKYFDPEFYDYDRNATYFDRAHCTIIDIITTTGLIGLLAYLSIFLFIFIYLIRAYRKNNLNKNELAIILGLIVAYFVQNLAVFDSFATYLYFMMILGFIYFIGLKGEIDNDKNKRTKTLKYVVLPLAVVFGIFGIVNNINSMSMAKDTITAYAYTYSNGLVAGSNKFAEVFKYHTGLERDARESYINLVLESSDQVLKTTSSAEVEKVVLLAIEAAETNEDYNINDNLILTRLAKVYDLAGRFYFYQNNSEKGSYYSNLALNTLDRAIEVSPGRIPLYLTKANLLMNFGKNDEAISSIEYAKNLNTNMPEPYCQLANVYFILKDSNNFLSNLKACQEKGGFSLMDWNDFLTSVENYYYNNKDYKSLTSFYEIVLASQTDDDSKVSLLSSLAMAYFEDKNLDMAETTALKIISINENYTDEVNAFLENIKEARAGKK